MMDVEIDVDVCGYLSVDLHSAPLRTVHVLGSCRPPHELHVLATFT